MTLDVSRGGRWGRDARGGEGGLFSPALCPGLKESYKGPTLNRTVTLLVNCAGEERREGPPFPRPAWGEDPKGSSGKIWGKDSFAFALKPITRAPRIQRKEMKNRQTAKGKNFAGPGQARWVVALCDCPVSPSLRPHAGYQDCGQAKHRQQPFHQVK